MSRFIDFLTFNSQKCAKKTKGNAHPDFGEDLEKKIRRYYAPLNQKLYQIIGFNFTWKEDID